MTQSDQQAKKVAFTTTLGAALVAATTQVGPGFTTQSALFSAQYLGAFFLCIIAALALDIITQANVYRILCFTRKRGQEVAAAIHPVVGYLLTAIVVFGICVFQFSNVSGTGLGMSALFGTSTAVSTVLCGLIAMAVFLSRSANKIINILAQVLGAVLILTALILVFMAKPPVGEIPSQIAGADVSSLLLPTITILGSVCGGYGAYIGSHRLLDSGVSGAENYYLYKRTQLLGTTTVYVLRVLLVLVTFGAVMHGATIDMANPAPSSYQAVAGMFGYRLYGAVILAAGTTTILGAAAIFLSFTKTHFKWIAAHERQSAILFIGICTVVDVFLGQPVNLLVAAGSINSLVLPFTMLVMLIASHSKRIMGEDYRHPVWMTVGAAVVFVAAAYLSTKNIPNLIALFQ
ncbi:divalent metal cation transporter [Oscillibacter hominis]|uniref:Divalent metal cation transporter n=1 Tax=Oscillibacter hominis TaxID=2763056 RepID=A0A7G9B512_9FIRM|nr:divalent metal cation transporter [Oscillibacter hominis]QNL44643.1 divalent metal cation transporter [Oscillibacter hominis]